MPFSRRYNTLPLQLAITTFQSGLRPSILQHPCCMRSFYSTQNESLFGADFGKHAHTFIHNWPLQPISQDFGLVSHTTQAVCANFIRAWRDLQFKVDSELQAF